MPNRIIKESLCSSEKISQLTDFQFRLWIGLITQADDAGRFDARPAIIKGYIFPLRDRVTVRDIGEALHALAAIRCVSLYEIDGKPYGTFPGWTDHQRVRDVRPRFPAPPEDHEKKQNSADFDNLPQSAADRRRPPRNAAIIQSESESESVSESNPCARARSAGGSESGEVPNFEEVTAYFSQKHYVSSAESFFSTFERQGWKLQSGDPVRNWRAVADAWEKSALQAKDKSPKTSQSRNYGSFDTDEFFQLALKRSLGRAKA